MRAAILAVGSELLGADRADTNSLRLAAHLADFGVAVVRKSVVGDDEAAIASELGHLAERCDLVLVCGGLGPTADDVTREAVAMAAGRSLRHDAQLEAGLRQRFARFSRRMPEGNLRQAMVIEGAEVLENRRGTAPGQRLEVAAATVFLFPGVPEELEGLVERFLRPWLEAREGGRQLETVTLKVACVPESQVDEELAPAYAEFGRPPITLLAGAAEVRIRLSASGEAEERSARLSHMAARVRELLGDRIYAASDRESLEAVVGGLLLAEGATLATAESCTGGLIAERLTRVPGASGYLVGAVVAYANELKSSLLGVPSALIDRHGAVSPEVAAAMARGVAARTGARLGLAATGIAGPGGGSAEKPVGTVHLALCDRAGAGHESAQALSLPGNRERVRWWSSQFALERLRQHLLSLASGR